MIQSLQQQQQCSVCIKQALPRLHHLHPLALLSTFSVDQIALPHHLQRFDFPRVWFQLFFHPDLDQGAAELVEEDKEEVDEGEDEHDAQDGDEGVRGLPRQERVYDMFYNIFLWHVLEYFLWHVF